MKSIELIGGPRDGDFASDQGTPFIVVALSPSLTLAEVGPFVPSRFAIYTLTRDRTKAVYEGERW